MTTYVAQEIARIKNMSYEDVVDITTGNAIRAYGLEKYLCK